MDSIVPTSVVLLVVTSAVIVVSVSLISHASKEGRSSSTSVVITYAWLLVALVSGVTRLLGTSLIARLPLSYSESGVLLREALQSDSSNVARARILLLVLVALIRLIRLLLMALVHLIPSSSVALRLLLLLIALLVATVRLLPLGLILLLMIVRLMPVRASEASKLSDGPVAVSLITWSLVVGRSHVG